MGAVVAAWTGARRGLAEIGASALPRLKSGLKLQRCKSGQASPANACPTSITVSSTTQLPLTNIFPGQKTGVGALVAMAVGPSGTNWDGNSNISESLRLTSSNCPASFGDLCAGSSTFTVGQGGVAADGLLHRVLTIFFMTSTLRQEP